MLTVLIVENETLDRVHLKTLIDWESLGYRLVGEAENGGDALRLIETLSPDIVITDIRMPVMNGLELIAACRDQAAPHFLIMSGYDDYALVRRGLTLGAHDYLRKFDVNPTSLLEALEGIRAKRGARAGTPGLPPPSRPWQLLLPLLRGQTYDETELARGLAERGIVLRAPVHCGVIRVDETTGEEDLVPTEVLSHSPSILGITEEILRDSFDAVCVESRPGSFAVFASPRHPGGGETFEQAMERLLDMLSLYLNLQAKAGVGVSHGEPRALGLAYERAVAALKSRFFFEDRRIILWNEVPAGISYQTRSDVLVRKEDLRLALDEQRKDLLAGFFDHLKNDIVRLEWTPASIKEGLIELNYLVREYLEANQLAPSVVLKRSRVSYEDIGTMQDVGQARRWIQTLSEDLGEFLSAEARVEDSRVVHNTKRFVAQHYGDDISLARAAAEAGLSPNYFSSIFKLHSGQSFIEYLSTVRIAAAKQLLAESDLLIYEVAERCGYHDSFYFNRVFKKLTGKSPGAFKKSSLRGR